MDREPSPRTERELADRCAGIDRRGTRNEVADVLLRRLARRRRWTLHRHVHLVAAFEAANARRPISSMLSVGSGSGISELFLAATNPRVQFVLSDVNPAPLDWNRKVAGQLGIENVARTSIDLLEPRRSERHDFVSAIEVLEHIEDDRTAMGNLLDHAAHHAHVLVPYCDPLELVDPRRRQRDLDRFGHHRPGYPHEEFGRLFGDATPVYVRNAYLAPEAPAFRHRLDELADEDLEARRLDLVVGALADVRDVRVAGGWAEAQAIEALLDVRDGRSSTIGGADRLRRARAAAAARVRGRSSRRRRRRG